MPSNRRPVLVTLLGVGVLFFSTVHIAGLIGWLGMPELQLSIPKWYLLLKNSLWMVMGLAAAFGLFFTKRWAPNFTRGMTVGFTVWYWTDRLVLVHSDFADITRPFAAGLTLLSVATIFWILNRRGIRILFRENSL